MGLLDKMFTQPKLNNPVPELTPTINEIAKKMNAEDIARINAILDNIKPIKPE